MPAPARRWTPTLLALLALALSGCAQQLPLSDEQLARVRDRAQAIMPISTPTSFGTSFFVTPEWALTAAHVVDDAPRGARISVELGDTGEELPLSLALPPGAENPDRLGVDDWAVLYRHASSDIPFLHTPINPSLAPTPGQDVFAVGLSGFDEQGDERRGRAMRLRVTHAPLSQDHSPDLIWMRWPYRFAPHGFSGGPLFAEDADGELVAVGVIIHVYYRGWTWWLVARRISDEMVRFAEDHSAGSE
ncbi:MAG: serine protease [Phycisphaerales bacterium]